MNGKRMRLRDLYILNYKQVIVWSEVKGPSATYKYLWQGFNFFILTYSVVKGRKSNEEWGAKIN